MKNFAVAAIIWLVVGFGVGTGTILIGLETAQAAGNP
jgi:hypothetical protein